MSARSILYGMILGILIFANGAVRLYVAIPPMPTASLTDEELDMMWVQLEVNKRTWEDNQARLAVSNSAQTPFIQTREGGVRAPQTLGITNSPAAPETKSVQ